MAGRILASKLRCAVILRCVSSAQTPRLVERHVLAASDVPELCAATDCCAELVPRLPCFVGYGPQAIHVCAFMRGLDVFVLKKWQNEEPRYLHMSTLSDLASAPPGDAFEVHCHNY